MSLSMNPEYKNKTELNYFYVQQGLYAPPSKNYDAPILVPKSAYRGLLLFNIISQCPKHSNDTGQFYTIWSITDDELSQLSGPGTCRSSSSGSWRICWCHKVFLKSWKTCNTSWHIFDIITNFMTYLWRHYAFCISVARRRSVRASTPVTQQPMFGFLFKIDGNIPWENISTR